MATDVLITSYETSAEVKREISKLRFMLRMRGFTVVDDLAARGSVALAALAIAARDATWVVVVLDATVDPKDHGLALWHDAIDRIHSVRNRGLVLVSASGPAQRTGLSDRLRGQPITRLDLPLGFHRVLSQFKAKLSLGTSPSRTSAPARLGYIDDAPATEDKLGRTALVEHVARMIGESERGMTISIEGAWGSGKSTFMNQLKASLSRGAENPASGSHFRFVAFNPWRLDKADSLWASFAIAFYDQIYTFSALNLKDPSRRRGALQDLVARGCLAYRRYDVRAGRLPILKLFGMIAAIILYLWFMNERSGTHKSIPTWGTLLPYLAALLFIPWFTGLGRFIWSMKPMAILKDIASHHKSPDFEGRLPFLQQFQEDFEKVRKSFSHCRVVVIIDDIDRCEPAVAAELCQAMSLMIPEQSNTIFIIAMDREKVAAGLAARADKVLPILAAGRDGGRGFDGARALDYGFQFLEKTVQLAVRLPPAHPSDLCRLVTEGSASDERDALINRVASVLGHNPRRVKHFLNVLSINDHLLDGDGDGELAVTRPQLAKLLAITLRWPRIVPDLVEEPTLLADLEELAVDPDARIVGAAPESAFARWYREEDLLELLAQDIKEDKHREGALRLTFLGLDVRRLLGARRPCSTIAIPPRTPATGDP